MAGHGISPVSNVLYQKTINEYMMWFASQETWTSTLKAAQSRWSEAVALELAAETEKMSPFQKIDNEEETEQDTTPKSPDEVMSQTQMLSYYKPIESQCWQNANGQERFYVKCPKLSNWTGPNLLRQSLGSLLPWVTRPVAPWMMRVRANPTSFPRLAT